MQILIFFIKLHVVFNTGLKDFILFAVWVNRFGTLTFPFGSGIVLTLLL